MSPTVERIDKQDLEEFCEEAGYDLNIVPTDALLVPPEKMLIKLIGLAITIAIYQNQMMRMR